MPLKEDDKKAALETLPILDSLPDEKVEEEKDEPSFIRKLDFDFDPDCVTCKYISASVCYGSGVLVLSSLKQIPPTKLPAKVISGLFGIGLFAVGTLRLFVPGNDPNAPLFGGKKNETIEQDTSS
ncbi:uncharacterized protein [Acropora muricata]|uniref:uncharacterized protein isoform X1 n=1 Tax=Acropora muricata TaxID=159855 RepID=UPI0034E397FF